MLDIVAEGGTLTRDDAGIHVSGADRAVLFISGGSAAVAEMLLQCQSIDAAGRRVIHILPVLPPAWPQGRVAGRRTRGGHRVDLVWDSGKSVALTLTAALDETVVVRHGNDSREIHLTAGETRSLEFPLPKAP